MLIQFNKKIITDKIIFLRNCQVNHLYVTIKAMLYSTGYHAIAKGNIIQDTPSQYFALLNIASAVEIRRRLRL